MNTPNHLITRVCVGQDYYETIHVINIDLVHYFRMLMERIKQRLSRITEISVLRNITISEKNAYYN